jgi:hypothetical protein
MKRRTAMKRHISTAFVDHPAGAPLDMAYRVVLAAIVDTSSSVRKHCT